MYNKAVKRAQHIADKLNKMIEKANEFGVPVVYDDEQINNVVFYFNEEYGKIFIDKSWIN